MEITRLALHEAIGETRAAAFAGSQPVALFADPQALGERPRVGDVLAARLGKPAPDGSGFFVTLETGGEAFLAGRRPDALSEGSALNVLVRSEARRDKRARVSATRELPRICPALEAWRARLPGPASHLAFTADADAANEIDAAFEHALAAQLTLPGGGRLHLMRTPALTAIDIDSAGRRMAGGRAAALDLNVTAARQAARQLSLRGLGGLAVLDCVGPLSRGDGAQVKAAFLATFRAISTRKAEALAPSPFGLMEISTAWRETPIDELYLDEAGTPTAMAVLLAGLRALEREAQAQRGATLVLRLPGPALDAFNADRDLYAQALTARFGGRVSVAGHARPSFEVHAL